jgi:hypothetical protein
VAYSVVVLLLTKDQTKFRLLGVWLVELGPEQHHHPVLQEVIELLRVRVQSLGFKVVDLLIGDINLEADDISVLDFTLGEGVLRFHKLNHARFDFLGKGDV